MHINGRSSQESSSKWQQKHLACFTLSEMKIWLGGFMLLFVFMVILLRFRVLEGPLMRPYLDMLENQPSLFFSSNNSAQGKLHLDAEESSTTIEPPKQIETAKDPPIIRLVLSHVKHSAEASVLSLWKHLSPVLSRSDCFPEAKRGMEESENNWREMIEEHVIESLHKGHGFVNRTSEKQCPYSHSSVNQTFVDGLDAELEIPCGLVVDSSITIVGMPWGAEMNFAIELLGPKLPGEPEPSVVLHFNARLQGDRITDEPVIVQNTWSKEHDWGDEERCPNSESVSRKVDGLDTCTEQVGKAVIRKNSTSLKGPMVGNDKSWFPFMNGLPFAATLWAGWEGFHMTINGKHVSSFEYRQNLKPSLVNAVRLKGSVKPISILATGLPTSEDITHVDLKFLKAPPLVRKQRNELFIGVFSTGNNFDRRMAVRRSWMQYEAVRSGKVTVRFFVGQHANKQVNKEIWREAVTYGDIQLMPFVDYYNLITIKTIAICIFGTEQLRSKYIMKTDDDTFVRVDEVLSVLNKAQEKKGLLYGLLEFDSEPHRDPNDKWFISAEEWPHPSYPPWAHGPGYIISRDIASYIVQGHKDRSLKLFKLEDVSMGIWIEEYKKKDREVNYVNDNNFNNAGCNDGYVIAHYQNPKHMTCLWGKLKEGAGAICCNDP
ncbi:hypothetical protein GOP47_0025802 [Adiantum capillus-veneris]|uniref:Galectin domain-containing protein n=1 Tax=Adiantum capillus-veneris TaxID=13818 RepID=A0A9D4Z2G8_ADICA|nr:hypothetical protein GOP47_0025802 [Adiantum capillus-veneris]